MSAISQILPGSIHSWREPLHFRRRRPKVAAKISLFSRALPLHMKLDPHFHLPAGAATLNCLSAQLNSIHTLIHD